MFDRFSDHLRQAFGLARQAAVALGHDALGTEHLFLGMIDERNGTAVRILVARGCDLHKLRAGVEALLPSRPRQTVGGPMPFTPAAKRVLEQTLGESMAMGHGHVGTEHLLLALLSEEKGIAACILGDAKVTCDDVRNAISSQSHAVPSRVVRWSRLDFSNLDERTKKAFGLSRQEALRMKQDQIDTEHLLLGLMGAGGMVLDALEKLEVDPGRLRDAIERRVPPGRAEGTHGALPFTQGAKQVLELALDEAELLGHDNIDGGHLLVGLMKEEKGVAAQVLRTAGVSLESARQALGREKRS